MLQRESRQIKDQPVSVCRRCQQPSGHHLTEAGASSCACVLAVIYASITCSAMRLPVSSSAHISHCDLAMHSLTCVCHWPLVSLLHASMCTPLQSIRRYLNDGVSNDQLLEELRTAQTFSAFPVHYRTHLYVSALFDSKGS